MAMVKDWEGGPSREAVRGAAETLVKGDTMTYERITCADVEVGDHIAHAKSHIFYEIEKIEELPTTRRLHLVGGGNWRPRYTTKLWRQHA